MAQAPHTYIASYVILRKENEVLLSRRFQTGFEDGKYSLPAGHVETNETFARAAIREAEEEVGVVLDEADLSLGHIMHRKAPEREYMDAFYLVNSWSGEIKNREPNKCDELSWFPADDLPDSTIPYVREAIRHSFEGTLFSEYGF